MWKKILTVSLLFIFVISFTAACQKGTIKDEQSQDLEPIRVGLIYPLSGDLAIGGVFRDGATFAAESINQRGGINGRKIDLIVEDSHSDTKTAMNAFNKLTEISQVNYIMTTLSRVGMNLKPLAEEQHKLMFVDIAHPEAVKDSLYILRHSQNLEQEAEIMVGHVVQNNFSQVGILAMNDDFGLAFIEKLKSLITDYPNIKFFYQIINPDEKNLGPTVLKLLQNELQMIIIGGGGKNYGLAVKQLREEGYTGELFGPVGITLVPGTIEAMGEAKKGMYYLYFDIENIMTDEFKNKFTDRFDRQPELFAFLTYTDIELLVFAIKNVGEDPLHIANFIKNLKEFKGTYETVKITPEGNIYPPLVVKRFE